jgi:hypothetical protein
LNDLVNAPCPDAEVTRQRHNPPETVVIRGASVTPTRSPQVTELRRST